MNAAGIFLWNEGNWRLKTRKYLLHNIFSFCKSMRLCVRSRVAPNPTRDVASPANDVFVAAGEIVDDRGRYLPMIDTENRKEEGVSRIPAFCNSATCVLSCLSLFYCFANAVRIFEFRRGQERVDCGDDVAQYLLLRIHPRRPRRRRPLRTHCQEVGDLRKGMYLNFLSVGVGRNTWL